MTASIRLLTIQDILPFRDLLLRGLKEEPSAFLHDDLDALAWPDERFAKFLKNGQMVGIWVANVLTGFAGLTRYQGTKVRHKGNIGPVYVAPEARGQGFATQMIQMLEKMAIEAGIERLLLSTDVTNTTTVALYTRLGFEPWGVEKHVLKLRDGSYVDDMMMAKSLL